MIIFALFLTLISSAFAQQQQPTADPALLQKAISVLVAQRNAALNAQVDAEARAGQLADDNAKLKAELEQLKTPK